MSRELKFRAWDRKYSQTFATLGGNGFRFFDLTTALPIYGNAEEFTVQQFTGLKDKNGQEIYEGDILSVHIPKARSYRNGEVIWSEEYLTYLIKFWWGKEYESDYLCGRGITGELEVIGNIFENPEILKS